MDAPKEQFTVESKPKIELIKGKATGSTSTCLSIFKWVVTILMFCTILFCLVISKLSLISLAQRLRHANITAPPNLGASSISSNITAPPNLGASSNSSSDGSVRNYESDVAYTMIILFMMIPHLISFIRAFCRSAFSSIELWPGRTSLYLGITAAVFETAGLCLFSLVVISSMRNFMHSIFLMNGIFIAPVMCLMVNAFRQMRCFQRQTDTRPESVELRHIGDGPTPLLDQGDHAQGRGSLITLHLFSVSAMFSLAGLCVLMYVVETTIERVSIPVSIVLLSIAWCPPLLKFQSQPAVEQLVEHDAHESSNIKIRSARHRMTLISSLIKLVLTLVFSYCLDFLNLTNTSQFPLVNGFKYFLADKQMVSMFFLQVFGSLVGYLTTWLVCKINLQKSCFVFPFLLSTPVAIIVAAPIVGKCEYLLGVSACFDEGGIEGWKTILLGLLLWISGLSFNFQFFKSQQFLMAKEEVIFWLPTYDSILLEQHMLLNRKNEITDERYINYRQIVKDTHIYICTTMYHEADFEMEQLLHSIAKLDEARKESGRQMEAHVFFDDGARDNVIKMYALQLLSLLESTMHIDAKKVNMLETPYGLQLKYLLPHGMQFVVHLKDNVKVKNKKRWSQVMYMSYILDYKGKKDNVSDDLSYILATDADVKFSHTDVMALMDFMSRDPKIAAVCGRTHPMGSGPIVWYQIFDYAIGHWLQKVANHVMGTVLCSPGCFSVYRARAVRDVLPLYATGVNSPMDFLMKDMGEDRWFCTLLVEAGWKLEYCATAADSTYCPDEFEEFFKQRRRWGPSTFANQIEVLNKQQSIRQNNDSINIFFMVYQMFLLLSSSIGPSTILLFMAAGLQFAYPGWFNMIPLLIFLIIVTISYAVVCLYCKPDTQMLMAKILAFFFAVIMAVTAVGCLTQISSDVSHYMYSPQANVTDDGSTPGPIVETNKYIFQMTTWYSFGFIGIFMLTGILHGSEVTTLVYGILYWLSLPSGHLLLTIYSIANLTDRSWGTREGKPHSHDDTTSWKEYIINYLRYVCRCCIPPENRQESVVEQMVDISGGENGTMELDDGINELDTIVDEDEEEKDENELPDDSTKHPVLIKSTDLGTRPPILPYANVDFSSIRPAAPFQPMKRSIKKPVPPPRKRGGLAHLLNRRRNQPIYGRPVSHHGTLGRKVTTTNSATTVEELLPGAYQIYAKNFKEHGYDNASFIAGAMKEKDLIDIGIDNRGHRKKLMVLIEILPPNELFQEVPENVEEWLIDLGLEQYWPNFVNNSYTEQRDLADLKYMSGEQISTLFTIKKEGHLRKLVNATEVLQYPTKAQKLIRETRKIMMNEPIKRMLTDDATNEGKEYTFWKKLREICLLPEQAAFNKSDELGDKLAEMRVRSFTMLLVINVLWLTFIGTIMHQGPQLHVMGASFSGVAFTFIYALVLILQFISLLIHRVTTFIHFIARAPFTPGNVKGNWAWRDADVHAATPDQRTLDDVRRKTLRHHVRHSRHMEIA